MPSLDEVLMAELARLMPQRNVTTGAASPRPLPQAGSRKPAPTFEDVQRVQRRREILEQPIPLSQMLPDQTVPSVDASMVSALANVGRAIAARRNRKISDEQRAAIMEREFEMKYGGDPFADALQPIIPPSLRGIFTPKEGGSDDGLAEALAAQRRSIDAYAGAREATEDAERPARIAHDQSALEHPDTRAIAEQRLFKPKGNVSQIDLGSRILLMQDGEIVGEMAKGASPDAAANRAAVDARAAEQRAFTAQQGELTRQQQRELAEEQRALTARGQDFTQQRAAVDDERLQAEADRKAADAERERAAKYEGALDQFEQGMGLLDRMARTDENGELVLHPGFAGAVGAKGPTSLFGLLNEPIGGTEAADFTALVNQLSGRQFLEAFASLRGGGQISNVEGQKAEQAIMNLARSQTEPQFLENLSILRDVMSSTLERERLRAGSAARPRVGANSTGATTDLSNVTDDDLMRSLGL